MPFLRPNQQFESVIRPTKVEANEAMKELYARCASLPTLPRRLFGKERFSVDAIYQFKGQLENEFTRAFVVKIRSIGEVAIRTDKIRYLESNVIEPLGPEFEHCRLAQQGRLLLTQYNYDPSDRELLRDIRTTLDIVELVEMEQANRSPYEPTSLRTLLSHFVQS